MYVIYKTDTKEIVGISYKLPNTMPIGKKYIETINDIDVGDYYIDDSENLVLKETLDYTMSNGILTVNNTVIDVLNIIVFSITEDEFGINENVLATYTLDLSQTNTIDLSAYLNNKARIYSQKYKLIEIDII